MVAAVAARVIRGVEVHPVLPLPSGHAVATVADALARELNAPLEAPEIDRFVLPYHRLLSCSSSVHRLGPAT
jgi:hypothetical protein